MKTYLLLLVILGAVVAVPVSCKRDLQEQINAKALAATAGTINSESSTLMPSTTCVEDQDNGIGMDTILTPTILGYRLIGNPYSLANMQQAYTNLYGNANGVALTHKYVRFKPSSPQQLSVLENLEIDLFDHPLDYDVIL